MLTAEHSQASSVSGTLLHAARDCLQEQDPERKCRLTALTLDALREERIPLGADPDCTELPQVPGRPAQPRLVAPRDLPRRRLNNPAGRVALLHAIAHIEFNAINLAWDAVARFCGMPEDYYRDWAQVAGEEAYHFKLLCNRLDDLGCKYGDFPAHDGLWEMAISTRHDVMHRMALVPRVLEARGLDVTPGMIERLESAGDTESADVLRIILRDEVGHVEIGTRWFRYLCARRNLEPDATFAHLVRHYMKGSIRGPLNHPAREQAGFSRQELEALGTTE